MATKTTTARKPAARKATKAPSAAELARREAQAKRDTGAPQPVHVEVMGVALDVDPTDVDDFDAMVAMEQGDYRPMLELLIPDEGEREAALTALREESGKLRYSKVVEFVQSVFQSLRQGN
nr:MAG TPA: hypothetical protein [Caudoviricetes sp.]DAK01452.1 MAG TPA: hypothetical protein [Caudoviricetes sp.]